MERLCCYSHVFYAQQFVPRSSDSEVYVYYIYDLCYFALCIRKLDRDGENMFCKFFGRTSLAEP